MFSSFENYVHKGPIYVKKRFLHAVKQGCMLNFLLQAVLYIGSNYLKAKKNKNNHLRTNTLLADHFCILLLSS